MKRMFVFFNYYYESYCAGVENLDLYIVKLFWTVSNCAAYSDQIY